MPGELIGKPSMESPVTTSHEIFVGDSRSLNEIPEDTVELVVTSPPYPMIEMWDDLFEELNSTVGELLDEGDGEAAFEAMHTELDMVWSEIERVLVPGGIACINIGDATRKINGAFQLFPNHARITSALHEQGFQSLPGLLWHKPTNSKAKFMGSGPLSPNQYVTLEHEHILVFRNGSKARSFEPKADHRYKSAYFWEERNKWFSDLWTDIRGVQQTLADSTNPVDGVNGGSKSSADDGLRDRSAAYPFEVPYRLICMYSVYGDTVLDPFWGTGTTSLAAQVAARNSIGYEYDNTFVELFDDRMGNTIPLSKSVVHDRLTAHQQFVVDHRAADEDNTFDYRATNYNFPVKTKREKEIQLYAIKAIDRLEQGEGYTAIHQPITESRPETFSLREMDDNTSIEQLTFQTEF